MTELLALAAVVTALVGVNALYVAAEFAIIAVRPSRLRALSAAGHPLAPWLLDTVRSTRRLDAWISTAQAGITMASIGLAMYAEESLAHLVAAAAPPGMDPHQAHLVSVAIALAALTYLHVVPGEMLPKSLALVRSEATTLAVALPMRISRVVFWPLVAPLTVLGALVLRLLRVPNPSTRERVLSADELGQVISQSTAGGLLTESEGRMLLSIFAFGDRSVRDVMTPRARVEALDAGTPPESVARRIAASRHHRFPVTDGDLDHILGVLHLKDLLRWELASASPPDVRSLARPAMLVRDDARLEALLELFRKEHGRLAVVVDATGVTVGVVALHDLAEEIVGTLPE